MADVCPASSKTPKYNKCLESNDKYECFSNLDKNEYEIIGSLNYDLIKKTNNPDLKSSNEFIIRKIVFIWKIVELDNSFSQ